MKKNLCSLAVLALAPAVVSQTPPAPSASPKVIVLRAAHMLDVKNGRTIDDPVIVITGERISAISGSVPDGATTITLPGTTLVP